MEKNLQTNNLIQINYPVDAGGKFISLCLAVNDQVLHQHKKIAQSKINKKWNENKSFDVSKSVILKSIKINSHYELGCLLLSGFMASQSIDEQNRYATDFWKELTNQNEYYFCLMNNTTTNRLSQYKNSKHITLKNWEWIMDARKVYNFEHHPWKFDHSKHTHTFFDMSSIKEANAFKNEITLLFSFLKLKLPNLEYLEKLRQYWVETFTIGYCKDK